MCVVLALSGCLIPEADCKGKSLFGLALLSEVNESAQKVIVAHRIEAVLQVVLICVPPKSQRTSLAANRNFHPIRALTHKSRNHDIGRVRALRDCGPHLNYWIALIWAFELFIRRWDEAVNFDPELYLRTPPIR